MNALDRLIEYLNASPDHWWEQVELYAEHGLAHLTPKACLLARPVSSQWSDEEICFPSLAREISLTHTLDAVHIHLAVGSLREIRRLLETFFPSSPLVTFQRHGGPLLRIPRQTLARLTPRHYGITIQQTESPEEARPTDEGEGNQPGGTKAEPSH